MVLLRVIVTETEMLKSFMFDQTALYKHNVRDFDMICAKVESECVHLIVMSTSGYGDSVHKRQ